MIKVIYTDKFGKDRCFTYSDGLMNLAENMVKHLELQGVQAAIKMTGNTVKNYEYTGSKEKLISSVPKFGIVKVSNTTTDKKVVDTNKVPVMIRDASGNIVKRKRGRPPKNQVIVADGNSIDKNSVKIPD